MTDQKYQVLYGHKVKHARHPLCDRDDAHLISECPATERVASRPHPMTARDEVERLRNEVERALRDLVGPQSLRADVEAAWEDEDRISRVLAIVDRLVEERDEARAMLREVEWRTFVAHEDGRNGTVVEVMTSECVFCEREEPDHAPDCRLAALIGEDGE